VTTEEKAELTRRVKELEKQAADLPAISARADKLKAEVRATQCCCGQP